MEIVVSNPTRSRKWGWGYSTAPERNSTRIPSPPKPDYTGTLDGITRQIKADRNFASYQSGGTWFATAWFYDGHEITGYVESGSNDPHAFNHWLQRLDGKREWCKLQRKPFVADPITLIVKD